MSLAVTERFNPAVKGSSLPFEFSRSDTGEVWIPTILNREIFFGRIDAVSAAIASSEKITKAKIKKTYKVERS